MEESFNKFLQNHPPRGGKLEWTQEDMRAAHKSGLQQAIGFLEERKKGYEKQMDEADEIGHESTAYYYQDKMEAITEAIEAIKKEIK